MTAVHSLGIAPYTANIGEGIEPFAGVADVQRAVDARVSGRQSSREWYAKMRSIHGAKIRDARGKVVATISYNARLWLPSGTRDELVLPDSQA